MDKKFFSATATLIGTIVGVGIFGIPYVVAKAGFFIGLFFLLGLGLIALIFHLVYGEIILRTKGKHRLVGYAWIYLGKWGKGLISFTSIFIFYGALLAYIIVGGKFLATIFGGNDFVWSLVFFGLSASAVFFGLRIITKIEIVMSLFLVLVVFLIFFKGRAAIELSHLAGIRWQYFFLPYGVILWAVGGWAAIPEMQEILQGHFRHLKKTIVWGTLLPILLYLIFVLTVVGITGEQTSPEAIEGLITTLKDRVLILGAVFGLLAVITSFLILGLSLKKIFWYDYGLNKHLAWFLAVSVPLAAYLSNLRDFIAVIGFLGATLAGLEGIILIMIYQKARQKNQRQPEYSLKLPLFVCYGLMLILAFGIIYQIIHYF